MGLFQENTKNENYQLILTQYFKPGLVEKGNDKILIVYKDLKTNEKKFEVITDPEFEFYINKDEYWTDLPVTFIDPEKTELKKVKFKTLFKDIAYDLGKEQVNFFNECVQSKRFGFLRQLHMNANLHGSDVEINDYYIGKFLDFYPPPEKVSITKSFLDIETDIIDYTGGFPDEHEAPVPILMISYLDVASETIFVFITDNENNQSMQDFKENLDDFKESFAKEILENDQLELNINISFYETEIEMITNCFKIINKCRPDFCGIFNMKFDVLTIINRIKKANKNELKIMCPKEIPTKKIYFHEDFNNQSPADKGDYLDIASYTNYVDVMALYANLRKTMGKLESYSLDSIAEIELKKKKVEFEGEETIKNLPYINFAKFFKYNVYDTIRLRQIEEKVGDIDMLYNLGIMTRTRVNKTLKKTICLRNLANKFYSNQGYIMSNNRNVNNSRSENEEKFRGAFVSSPLLNRHNGIVINGKKSKYIFENVIDMDLSSLYPSIILAFNIDTSTQFGRILMSNDIGEDLAPEFIDYLISQNYLEIGNKYFNLPTATEIINMIQEKYYD